MVQFWSIRIDELSPWGKKTPMDFHDLSEKKR
jgi:hypothetical protein